MPGLLGPSGRALWRSMVAVYEFSPGEIQLLTEACRQADMLTWLAGQLADEPMLSTGSTGQPVPNPLIGSLNDARRVLTTLMASLALPMPGEDTGRVRTPTAAVAVRERWRREKEATRRG